MTEKRWETVQACVAWSGAPAWNQDHGHLGALLADGWEPFAVTPLVATAPSGFVYHLRREHKP